MSQNYLYNMQERPIIGFFSAVWSCSTLSDVLSFVSVYKIQFNAISSFTKRQILDSSKLKEFAVDNFKFYENGRKFSERLINTVGKGQIAHYKQFLLFQCFQKTCTPDT